jgi:hypothetical protein
MKLRRLLWGAVLLAGAFTAPVAALPVAAHAVGSTTIKTADSASNTTSVKQIPVECPQGEFVYGAGGSISGGGAGNVALQAVVPEAVVPGTTGAPVRVRVTAVALGAVTSTWSVTAWAVCGVFTTNLQIVPASDTSTLRAKEANARCPDSLRMYGTGFRINNGNGTVLVHDVIPGTSVKPTGVTVRATARTGLSPSWTLDGFAICANPAPTMSIVQATTQPSSGTTRGVNSPTCPTGTRAHGIGAQTFSPVAPGSSVDGRIALTTMAQLFTTAGGAGAAENGASVTEDWQLRVYLICSN